MAIPCIVPEPLMIEGSPSLSCWSVFIAIMVGPFLFISSRAKLISIKLMKPAFLAAHSIQP